MPGKPPELRMSPAAEAAAARLRARWHGPREGRVDRITVEMFQAFAASDIPSILLKGPSLARRLYEKPEDRPYSDSDLLVPAALVEQAESVLRERGFERSLVGNVGEPEWHADSWYRRGGGYVDLHHLLVGVYAPPEQLWGALQEHRGQLEIRGVRVTTLDDVGLAFHVSLHAAQHGVSWGRPIDDLERALREFSVDTWQKAAELAERVNAMGAFDVGLRLLPAGAELAEALSISATPTTLVVLNAGGHAGGALGLEMLAQAPGIGAKIRLAWRKLFPPAEFLEAKFPKAKRGGMSLLVARFQRFLGVVRMLPRAYSKWRAARRVAARADRRRDVTPPDR